MMGYTDLLGAICWVLQGSRGTRAFVLHVLRLRRQIPQGGMKTALQTTIWQLRSLELCAEVQSCSHMPV